MLKIAFIGCVKLSYDAFNHLLPNEAVELVGVVTKKESPLNSDFCSLEPPAKEANISCFLADGKKLSEVANFLKTLKPDVIYCFGWSHIIKKEILEIPALGVVGYHPAALPKNRGRHPIIWALALGLSETASTFFLMDEGIDSGDIISQETVAISKSSNASTLYEKLTSVALKQIDVFTDQLSSGKLVRLPQDNSQSNYWRKRSKKDGEIDWRMSAQSIYNLIRALTRPYVGAHCLYEEKEIKIWAAALRNEKFPNIEPGKVIKVVDSRVLVKCGDGVLELLEHEFEPILDKGAYL